MSTSFLTCPCGLICLKTPAIQTLTKWLWKVAAAAESGKIPQLDEQNLNQTTDTKIQLKTMLDALLQLTYNDIDNLGGSGG